MSNFIITQGDLESGICVALRDSDGLPVPALDTAESIKVRITRTTDHTLVLFDDVILDDVADAALAYSFSAGQTDEMGVFYVKFVVQWPGARPQSYPRDGYLVLSVTPKL